MHLLVLEVAEFDIVGVMSLCLLQLLVRLLTDFSVGRLQVVDHVLDLFKVFVISSLIAVEVCQLLVHGGNNFFADGGLFSEQSILPCLVRKVRLLQHGLTLLHVALPFLVA